MLSHAAIAHRRAKRAPSLRHLSPAPPKHLFPRFAPRAGEHALDMAFVGSDLVGGDLRLHDKRITLPDPIFVERLYARPVTAPASPITFARAGLSCSETPRTSIAPSGDRG